MLYAPLSIVFLILLPTWIIFFIFLYPSPVWILFPCFLVLLVFCIKSSKIFPHFFSLISCKVVDGSCTWFWEDWWMGTIHSPYLFQFFIGFQTSINLCKRNWGVEDEGDRRQKNRNGKKPRSDRFIFYRHQNSNKIEIVVPKLKNKVNYYLVGNQINF